MNRHLSVALICTACFFLPGASHASTPDACSYFAQVDAQAALGEPVGPARLENRSFGKGEATSCRYRSTVGSALKAKSVSLEVRHSDDDLTGSAKGIADTLASSGFKDVHQVSGIGTAAVWGTNSMLGKLQGELTVIKGKSVMLIILIEGLPNEADALADAQAIARKALAKL